MFIDRFLIMIVASFTLCTVFSSIDISLSLHQKVTNSYCTGAEVFSNAAPATQLARLRETDPSARIARLRETDPSARVARLRETDPSARVARLRETDPSAHFLVVYLNVSQVEQIAKVDGEDPMLQIAKVDGEDPLQEIA